MKKSLFLFLTAILAVGCSSTKIQTSLEEDKQSLFAASNESFVSDTSQYFTSEMVYQQKGDYFQYRYVIYDAKQTYDSVGVIISPDSQAAFFFGYDGEYTLTNDESLKNADKKIYTGIAINFSSTVKLTDFKAYFRSQQKTLFYTITVTEE